MPSEQAKTHPINIRVSQEILKEIDELTPDRRRSCRERFVMDAVQAYLGHFENVVYKKAESELRRRRRRSPELSAPGRAMSIM